MSASPHHSPLSRHLSPRRYPLNRLTRVLLLGSIGWLGAQTSALSAERTWMGDGGDSLWNTAGNWNQKPVTTGDDDLLFGSAGAGLLMNDFEGASFGRIDFLSGAGAYTLQGNAISLGANGFNNESSQSQVIDFDITLVGATGVNRFRAGAGDLVVNGVVSGTGRISTTSGAAGVVYLNGANTHSGGVAVNSALHIGHANALGSGIFVISGGPVTFGAGIGDFYTGGLAGSAGPVLLEDTNGEGITLHLGTGNGNIERGGTLSGKGGLVLDAGSSGKQMLSGANTYTGGTLIKSGTLELSGGGGILRGRSPSMAASFPSSVRIETRQSPSLL